jgi:hypothetical protein
MNFYPGDDDWPFGGRESLDRLLYGFVECKFIVIGNRSTKSMGNGGDDVNHIAR